MDPQKPTKHFNQFRIDFSTEHTDIGWGTELVDLSNVTALALYRICVALSFSRHVSVHNNE